VEPAEDDLLSAHVADEVHGALHQDPPVLRGRPAVPQDVAVTERDLGAVPDQFLQLLVGQPGEDVQTAQVLQAHQTVAR